MSIKFKKTASVILAAAIVSGGVATSTQVAAAAPAPAPAREEALHQLPAHAGKEKIVTVVKWVLEQVVAGGVQYLLTEASQSLTFVDSPNAAEAAARFWASVPTVSADSLTSPSSLVTFAKQAPNGSPNSRLAYVHGDPRALLSKIVSGGSRTGTNQYKVGTQTVTYTSGTKSNPPSIKVSDTFGSTKVMILA